MQVEEVISECYIPGVEPSHLRSVSIVLARIPDGYLPKLELMVWCPPDQKYETSAYSNT